MATRRRRVSARRGLRTIEGADIRDHDGLRADVVRDGDDGAVVRRSRRSGRRKH